MNKKIYFHIWNGHFKMWGYECYCDNKTGKVRVVFYWGKIVDSLNRLQSKEKCFDNTSDAYSHIQEKIDEKLRKGYVTIKSADYSKYTFKEIGLTQLINMIEKARFKTLT